MHVAYPVSSATGTPLKSGFQGDQTEQRASTRLPQSDWMAWSRKRFLGPTHKFGSTHNCLLITQPELATQSPVASDIWLGMLSPPEVEDTATDSPSAILFGSTRRRSDPMISDLLNEMNMSFAGDLEDRLFLTDENHSWKYPNLNYDSPSAFDSSNATNLGSKESESNDRLSDAAIKLQRSVDAAKDIIFEDGYANELSIGLGETVDQYGDLAIKAFRDIYTKESVSRTILAEALKLIGEYDDSRTEFSRRNLLIDALDNRSPVIRFGAVTGLANLLDSESVAAMKKARQSESDPLLKKALDRTLTRA